MSRVDTIDRTRKEFIKKEHQIIAATPKGWKVCFAFDEILETLALENSRYRVEKVRVTYDREMGGAICNVSGVDLQTHRYISNLADGKHQIEDDISFDEAAVIIEEDIEGSTYDAIAAVWKIFKGILPTNIVAKFHHAMDPSDVDSFEICWR